MQFIQNNWPLILVMIISERHAALAAHRQRRLSTVREVGALAATQLINRQNAVIARFARKQGLRRRTRAQRGTYSLVAACRQGRRARKLTSRPLIAYCDRGNRSRSAGSALSQTWLCRGVYAARRRARAGLKRVADREKRVIERRGAESR